jgi:hypothetical protein
MVLAVLVVSIGQTVAIPLNSLSPIDMVRTSDQQRLAPSANVAYDNTELPCTELPCSHHDPQGLACCMTGNCSMVAPWPAGSPSAPQPFGCGRLRYRPAVVVPPDGLGTLPTVPPPRHRI